MALRFASHRFPSPPFTPLHSTSLHKTPSNPVIPAKAGIQVRCAPPVVEQNLDSRLRGNDGLNDRKRSELALVFSSRPTKGPSPQPPHRAAMQLPSLHRAMLHPTNAVPLHRSPLNLTPSRHSRIPERDFLDSQRESKSIGRHQSLSD
jgi:hypothetical protein